MFQLYPHLYNVGLLSPSILRNTLSGSFCSNAHTSCGKYNQSRPISQLVTGGHHSVAYLYAAKAVAREAAPPGDKVESGTRMGHVRPSRAVDGVAANHALGGESSGEPSIFLGIVAV